MTTLQYTIRNIPPVVDKAIRKRAQQTGKSFNQTAVEVLTQGIFGSAQTTPPRMEDMFGVGGEFLDKDFDKAVAALSETDEKFWHDPAHRH